MSKNQIIDVLLANGFEVDEAFADSIPEHCDNKSRHGYDEPRRY